MNKVYMTDPAVVTAMGDLDSLYKGLCEHKTAIGAADRFNTKRCVGNYAALVPGLFPSVCRSMAFDLTDMLLDQLPQIPEDTALFTATSKAGIDILEQALRHGTRDANSVVPGSLAKYIACKLNLKNSGINISSACASGTVAVVKAAEQIAAGRIETALVISLDIISEFVFAGFSSLGAMSSMPSMPFDIKRDGLTLGEGASAVLLMGESAVSRLGKLPSARITGWGIAGDAAHITAPARDGAGLLTAINKALGISKMGADSISAVNAHGTGTVYNDMMELTVFRNLFGERGVPVNSIKGSIGHTLGASGGIEIALGSKIIKHGLLPGTVGFSDPEKGSSGLVSRENRSFSKGAFLTTNSGFGGINAAVIMEGVTP